MKKIASILLGPLLAISAYALISTSTAFAAAPYSCTWTGGINSNFNNSGNWSGCNSAAPLPGDNDNLIFDNTSLASDATLSNNISALNLTSITFQGNNTHDYSFTINGNVISLSGGITDTMDSDPDINAAVTLTGTQSFTTNGGGISMTTLDVGTNNLTTLDSISVTTLSGSGNIDITSDQAPNLTGLSLGPATSSYSGQITLENTAELDLNLDGGGVNPMGTGSILIKNGGTLLIDSSLDSVTLSNNITALAGAGGTNSGFGAIVSCLGDSSGCTTDGNDTTLTLSGDIALTGNTQIVNGAYYTGEPSAPTNTSAFTLTGAVSLNCYTLTAVPNSSTAVTLPPSTPTGCATTSVSGSSSGSSSASAPKTPSTGVGLIVQNAVLPLLGSVIAAIGLYVLGRRLSFTSKKN